MHNKINCKNVFIKILKFILLAFVSLFITTFFSSVVLHEYENLSCDQACFYLIGKGILAGKVPYVDFYDNKGPLTYLIYSLISLNSNFRISIFVGQAILVFFTILILKTYIKEIGIKRNSLCYIALFFICYVFVCKDAGLYTEDIALPLILLSILEAAIIFKNYESETKQKKLIFSYAALSVLFWLVALIRLNNAIIIAGLLFSVGIIMLIKKDFKSFGILVLSFIATGIIICAPVFLWLIKNNAFYECIYQSFLINFQYTDALDAASPEKIFLTKNLYSSVFYIMLSIGFLSLLFSMVKNKRNVFLRRLSFAMIIALILSIVAISTISTPAWHYLTPIVGVFYASSLLACSTIQCDFINKSKINDKINNLISFSITVLLYVVIIISIFVIIFVSIYDRHPDDTYEKLFNINTIKDHYSLVDSDYKKSAEYIASYIPEEDKDSEFGIDIEPRFYVYNDIYPSERIFICRRVFTYVNDDLHKEYLSYFNEDAPKWLISNIELNTIEDKELVAVLDNKYEFVVADCNNEYKSNNFYLYKLIED